MTNRDDLPNNTHWLMPSVAKEIPIDWYRFSMGLICPTSKVPSKIITN